MFGVAVHGEDAMVPKFDFVLHLPVFLARFGMLQSCLLRERKHRVVKKFANEMYQGELYREWVYRPLAYCHDVHFEYTCF